MHDTESGLDPASFTVTANFAIGGVTAGENLAKHFQPRLRGIWEWKLAKPVARLPKGTLIVSVKDRQDNVTRVERTFSVGPARK